MICVFDLDDTLYLERDYVHSGFAAVSRLIEARSNAICAETFFAGCWLLFMEGQRQEIFDDVLGSDLMGLDKFTVRECVDCYRSHTPQIKFCPDVLPVLDKLGQYNIVVITDGDFPRQIAKLKVLDVGNVLNQLIVNSKECFKPHPYAFTQVEVVFDCCGSDLVYIADNPHKDFQAPHERGWKTIRVRREGGLHHSVPSPDYLDAEWDTLTPLLDWLKKQRG